MYCTYYIPIYLKSWGIANSFESAALNILSVMLKYNDYKL